MKGISLARLERPETMKDSVYRNVRSAILEGTITSSVVLTENTLADRLGVSRTPVREAIQELEREGLLEAAGARGGKRVRQISSSEVKELFWLRRAVEGATVEHLANVGLDADEMQMLQEYLEHQRVALDCNDRAAFLGHDSSFHIALASFTGFPKVRDIITNLRQLFQLVGVRAISEPHRLEQVLVEHQVIVEAIQSGSPTAARKAMEDHLFHTETLSLAKLEAETGGSDGQF